MSLFISSLHLQTVSVSAHVLLLAPFLKSLFWVVLQSSGNKSRHGSASIIVFVFPLHLYRSSDKGNNVTNLDKCQQMDVKR